MHFNIQTIQLMMKLLLGLRNFFTFVMSEMMYFILGFHFFLSF
jgi:hypothetical protein